MMHCSVKMGWYLRICGISLYLNIAQAFLQVGNHLRELGPVLKWKKQTMILPASMLNNQTGQINPTTDRHTCMLSNTALYVALLLVHPHMKQRWTLLQKQSLDLLPHCKRTNTATLELFNYTSHPQTEAKVCLCTIFNTGTLNFTH